MRIQLGDVNLEAAPVRLGAILRLQSLWSGRTHMWGTAAFAALGLAWPTTDRGYPFEGLRVTGMDPQDLADEVVDRLVVKGIDPNDAAVAGSLVFAELLKQLPRKERVEEAAGNSSAQEEPRTST